MIHLSKSHQKLEPVVHWQVARRNPMNREALANLVNLLCGNVPSSIINAVVSDETYHFCKLCSRRFQDVGYHFVMDCRETNQERNQLWDNLTDELPIQGMCFLNSLDDQDMYAVLISGNHVIFKKNIAQLDKFIMMCALGILKFFTKVKQLSISD